MAKARSKLDRADWAKLSQDVQGLYSERDGTFFLDDDGTEELRNSLERQKAENKAAKERLAALGDIDPEEHKRLKQQEAEAKRKADIDKGNYEKILTEERATYTKELEKRDTHAKGLRAQLDEAMIDGELIREISKYPGARHKLLMPALKPQVRLKEFEGKFRAVVVDEKGEPRLKAGAKTADEFMGPADLVTEARNDKELAGAFPASGSGTKATTVTIPAPGSSTDAAESAKIAEQVRAGANVLSRS
jgi:hypothetical protein